MDAGEQAELEEHADMAAGVCKPYDHQSYREGHMTPVIFGSALRHFGVKELLDTILLEAPPPRVQKAKVKGEPAPVGPETKEVTGFVFKIQANMDPNHRDRIAFFRMVSGRFQRGMRLKTVAGKQIGITSPIMFMAQDREIADEAFAGDVIGIPNHGALRVGDALSESGDVQFAGIPNFAPEILRRVRVKDPMKAKHLRKALEGLAEEGVTQLFTPADRLGHDRRRRRPAADRGDGRAHRHREQPRSPVRAEPWSAARWLSSDDSAKLEAFLETNRSRDRQGSRRRAGVSRQERLGRRLRLRKEPGDSLHEDEGTGVARIDLSLEVAAESATLQPERAPADQAVSRHVPPAIRGEWRRQRPPAGRPGSCGWPFPPR